MEQPKDLGKRVSIIDLFDLELEQRTGSYVLHEEELTLIETSASPSIPHLLEGLDKLQIDPKEIKYIIVTHIHLDHAGGVGLLLESCPNASVIVHLRGERHLADPTRLIQGAKAVYGETFDGLFDPILPVPENRLITKEDGEKLKIGKDRTLTFLDTPGHAKHHFSIHDSYSNGVFTGDTIGILYPIDKTNGIELVLPTTSPNQFDPDVMLNSLKKIEKLDVDTIYFGHYGPTQKPKAAYQQLRSWLPKFVDVAETVIAANPGGNFDEKVEAIFQGLTSMVSKGIVEMGIEPNEELNKHIKLDLQICAMGLADYLEKKKKK
ncbi:MBL fold metallo-hydrolase [Paraliobacillus quinghaiensis]|uniref:MBL fold metallo-hydrolase n=1 Tax=Paraliobacillus quinghaiensis TaxID=470815 RepID=A0A917TI83_9BACI|nr:MBL fold metallo-hydrolase [Paraliobacillus quinghaiensis]GGM24422.1 MBL fold metallo-hydrolase [Paraliobacillus quinghaiensis]